MSHDISDMFPSIVSASPIMQNSSTRRFIPLPFSLFLLLLPLPFITATSMNSTDGSALSSFIASADPTNKLSSILNKHLNYCKWVGVKCNEGKVVRLVFENLGLQGSFSENTLTKLDQLRVLSLKHNKLTGPIPNLSPLSNLKTLFVDHNSFTGNFPISILSLHRIRILDLSHNDFTGKIPPDLGTLDGLYYLKLDWNSFNGTIPPLNQSSLIIFNVSSNNLTGPVPITVTLSSFNSSSFLANPGLCGRVIGKSCKTQIPPFFTYDSVSPKQEQLIGAPLKKKNIKNRARAFAVVVFGVLAGVLLVILLMGFWVFSMRKRSMPDGDDSVADSSTVVSAAAVEETALSVSEITLRKMQSFQMAKSGTLMFCAGETQIYSLDSLMRGSAEMLGRGTIGVTYKAVLENQLIVSVKRVESQSSNRVSKEMFESHMEMVGGLRHPNLVPLRAYFQAKEERLLIYDYQPNGSLFSLIHGSRSSRAKPLHWTSCLKIAEDVAQGLAYIHQASRLVHGNLKSSNVLLGPDFEACVTDFGLTVFEEGFVAGDSGSGYRAPETRKSNRRLSSKSDVYSFGVLLLELVTGKTPSQAFSIAMDLPNWVRSVMEEGGEERTGEKNLIMLLEIAMACVAVSPDQRPTMRQVLKMIEEIKELEMGCETIDSSTFPSSLI